MKKNVLFVVALGLASLLTGCVSSQSGDVYSRQDARRVQNVSAGTIVGLRPVTIEGTKSLLGVGTGAVLGGIAGSTMGGGRGTYLTAIAGAVIGGAAGAFTEEAVTKSNGVEITVREDSGYTRAYVQEAGERQLFRIGDRVRILSVNGQSRVSL